MKMKRRIVVLACHWGMVLTALACCISGLWPLVKRIGRPLANSHIEAWREVARVLPRGSVSVLCASDSDLTPVERSRCIAVAWEHAPCPVRGISLERIGTNELGVVASAFLPMCDRQKLTTKGFHLVAQNDYAAAWMHKGSPLPVGGESSKTAQIVKEMFGVIVVLGILVVICRLVSRGQAFSNKTIVILSFLMFCILAGTVLSHGLLPPNGLGVYGGKAKVLFLCGGFPSGFWQDAGYAVFQPSYPPGLAFLTYIAYLVSGGCGDWLVQLIPVGGMALLFAALANRNMSIMWLLVVGAFTLSPLSVKLATEFYAEPFSALFMILGIRRVVEHDGRIGWFTVGMAGLFRHEAVLLSLCLWLVFHFHLKHRTATLESLAVMLASQLVWQIFRIVVGAQIQDFDFTRHIDVLQIYKSFEIVIDFFVVRAWRFGGVLLFATLCWIGSIRESTRHFVVLLLFMGLSISNVCVISGFYCGGSLDWMLETTLPRVFWQISIVVLAVMPCRGVSFRIDKQSDVISVRALHDKIRSFGNGGGRCMDSDRVAPNNTDKEWSF